MNKLISFDIKADFGFLKKPDSNEPIYITYNMLHKPALLGILGAIIGLKGFKTILETSKKQKRAYIPEYYEKLNHLKVGIQPLEEEKGNYSKTVIRYNNGVGYASKEIGGNLIIDEQTLIKPSYRCFLILNLESDLEKQLYDNLENNKAEYLPYLGKNDFSIWWDNFQDYDKPKVFDKTDSSFELATLFLKKVSVKGNTKEFDAMELAFAKEGNSFVFFENLPVGYDSVLMQYEFKSFAYTDWLLQQNYSIDNLYQLPNEKVVQLF
ncbi:type I-B CRISPR-associated protein Cas5b [Bernardetia sp. OM2101]|uniref:type I-B CRISPR-associated protein Cas5b n=1 Tax=Bernardetia sp. OM2101 TaxID=3344876 RepID=UPI0035D0F3F7